MRPTAYVSHHIPGRMRLKMPESKRSPELLDNFKDRVASVPGVQSIELNPKTGSALILYSAHEYPRFQRALSSRISGEVLLFSDGSRRGHRGANRSPEVSALARRIIDLASKLDDAIKDATGNELDLRVILPLGIISLGAMSARTRTVTPLWLTLMIFAFNSFHALHSTVEAEEATAASESGVNGSAGG